MKGNVGYVAVALLGALVGLTEVLSRYRDDPFRSLASVGALTYIAVNAGGSLFALYAIRVFGWNFGFDSGGSRDLGRVLFAGFGALALFRTKLFTAAVKGESVSFGPSRILEQLLAISDRQVDRKQGILRSRTAAIEMRDVSFQKAFGSLPVYVLGLLENCSEDEQKRLALDVSKLLETTTMDDTSKAQALGVAVMRLIGPELFKQSVKALGPSIKRTPSK